MKSPHPVDRLAVTLLALLSSLLLADVAGAGAVRKPTSTAPQSGFVQVNGRHFELDGKPYYFAGANMWYGMYLGSPGDTGDRARLTRELDQLAARGINNLRVLAISENSTLKRAVTPAVIVKPLELDETLWQGLDFLLAEMARRDMKAVLYVNNFWQWSGGMATYVSWATGQPAEDPDVTVDWNKFIATSAQFYREPKAQEAFRFAVKRLMTRTNTVSGRRYTEDPTIMSWQLANEPRPGVDGDNTHFDAFTRWIDDSAGFMKQLAPRQLVSTGSEGWMGTAGSRELFVKSHTTKNVDYLTFHMWAPNWGWFKPKEAQASYAGAWARMQDYINWHIDTANEMTKPIVLEEFGINRDEGSFEPAATTVYRDKLYSAVFGLLNQRAAAGDAIAGSNFWAWGGAGRTTNADFMWRAGDSFVGDPPQEPQGLYCVFDSDVSTLNILAAHARQMSGIGAR